MRQPYHNKDDQIETLRSRDDVISDSVVGVGCLPGWLADMMLEKSGVLIDELTNQVTTECNGVTLY